MFVFFTHRVITLLCFVIFKVFMSKCRLLQDISTGVFRIAIPNGTIQLQSNLASQVHNTSHILIEFAELRSTSLFDYV